MAQAARFRRDGLDRVYRAPIDGRRNHERNHAKQARSAQPENHLDAGF
jgi:hypothetical protein